MQGVGLVAAVALELVPGREGRDAQRERQDDREHQRKQFLVGFHGLTSFHNKIFGMLVWKWGVFFGIILSFSLLFDVYWVACVPSSEPQLRHCGEYVIGLGR